MICATPLHSVAQSPGSLLKSANTHQEAGRYGKAAEAFERYLAFKSDDLEQAYNYAHLLEQLGEYEDAGVYYKQVAATRINKKKVGLDEFPRALFDYGRMLKLQGRHQEAIETLEQAKQRYREYNREAFLEEAEELINGALLGQEIRVAGRGFTLEPATSDYSSGFPVQRGKHVVIPKPQLPDQWEPQHTEYGPLLPLYVRQDKDGNPKDTMLWVAGCEGCEMTNAYWSEPLQSLFFTRCSILQEDKIRPALLRSDCGIYRMKRNAEGKWDEPEALPATVNDPGSTNTYPFVVEKTNKVVSLYFSSDRPGGTGGLDIWESKYNPKNDSWGRAQNLGESVNTPFSEITPFYHANTGVLYFSSDARTGLGGFDIYRSIRGGSRKIMPLPWNSSTDDLYYWLSDDEQIGYFTSSRDTAGPRAVDGPRKIYRFQAKKPLVPVRVAVRKSTNHKILNGASIQVLALRPETGEDYLLMVDTIRDRKPVTMLLPANQTFKLLVRGPGFFKTLDALSTLGMDDNLLIDKEFILRKIPTEAVVMENVYFEFGSAELSPASKPIINQSLIKLMRQEPDALIAVEAHTDDVGKEEDNLKLSQERAESVVNYVVSQGIERSRMQAIGYGESQPVAPNKNEDGSDNPEGRQQNRRTVFRITGER